MPAQAFSYSDDEDATPVVQALTEFSNEALQKDAVDAPLVIERIPNSFRRGNNYIPNALREAQRPTSGRTVEELEAAERARNNVYGLNRTVQNGQSLRPSDVSVDNPEARSGRNGGNSLFSRSDVHAEMSTLDDYEAVPVESFGLAMLRGMGFDPSKEDQSKKIRNTVRRPDFLGLGATQRPEDTKNTEDLAKKKYQIRKEERNYVPVVRINKKTGEIVKEEPISDQIRVKSEAREVSETSHHKFSGSPQPKIRQDSRSEDVERNSDARHRSHSPRVHSSRKSNGRDESGNHSRSSRVETSDRRQDRRSYREHSRDRDRYRDRSRDRHRSHRRPEDRERDGHRYRDRDQERTRR